MFWGIQHRKETTNKIYEPLNTTEMMTGVHIKKLAEGLLPFWSDELNEHWRQHKCELGAFPLWVPFFAYNDESFNNYKEFWRIILHGFITKPHRFAKPRRVAEQLRYAENIALEAMRLKHAVKHGLRPLGTDAFTIYEKTVLPTPESLNIQGTGFVEYVSTLQKALSVVVEEIQRELDCKISFVHPVFDKDVIAAHFTAHRKVMESTNKRLEMRKIKGRGEIERSFGRNPWDIELLNPANTTKEQYEKSQLLEIYKDNPLFGIF